MGLLCNYMLSTCRGNKLTCLANMSCVTEAVGLRAVRSISKCLWRAEFLPKLNSCLV